MDSKIEFLQKSVIERFRNKTSYNNNQGKNISITTKIEGGCVWFDIVNGEVSGSINIPIPYRENSLNLLKLNGVVRSLCDYYLEATGQRLDFMSLMYYVICDSAEGIIDASQVKKSSFVDQLAYSTENDGFVRIINNLQRAINSVIHRFPIHETDMNSFVINHRLMIIDSEFDKIADPRKRHLYQIRKANKYFPEGKTSMGLSDQPMSTKNYILDTDIKKLTPFGMRHHNPQRNLYSSLGMRGDDLPLVRSRSAQDLIEQGITRTGWNLFTAFVDLELTWEDQIIVSNRHRDKFVIYEQKITHYGYIFVKEGDTIEYKHKLGICLDGKFTTFKEKCDGATVKDIKETKVNVGGASTSAYIITIQLKKYFKDGVKITNTAANKGVMRMMDLGYAIHPKTGEKIPIDVIVSGKAVKKRKNYTQLLEALTNAVNGDRPIVIEDNIEVTMSDVETGLEKAGLPKDGCMMCHTQWGVKSAVCGKVFWGVTHDVESAEWKDTTKLNGRDLRNTGIKYSTVEFRSLETIFGKDNAITQEILSYAQGTDVLEDTLNIIKSKRGELPDNLPIVNASEVKAISNDLGTIISPDLIEGSIVDEHFHPDGFILQLPVSYEVRFDEVKREIVHEGIPYPDTGDDTIKTYTFNKIYVPSARLRRCWRHDTGKYGLSEVGVSINNIILTSQAYIKDTELAINTTMLYKTILQYFKRAGMMLSNKRGSVNVLGMSVRYPMSAKAVATLADNLPVNTVEIHQGMANKIKVKTGDVVLVERFPCLGFMSVRVQKVKVTRDELCKYTIRVSGNSLCSQGLDFDGDVLYVSSFHTEAAKNVLKKEFDNPNMLCYNEILKLNEKMGIPRSKEFTLQDYDVENFGSLTMERHAEIVDKVMGPKSYTGPVIALVYNLMRIMERSEYRDCPKTSAGVEVFLDRVGNSVFKMKHGYQSFHEIVVDSICEGDIDRLIESGFDTEVSTIICNVVKEKAQKYGVYNLKEHHAEAKDGNKSNIISLIVRKENQTYFVARASIEELCILYGLEQEPVDIPSEIYQWVTSGKAKRIKTELGKIYDNYLLKCISNPETKDMAEGLLSAIDIAFNTEVESL